MGSRIFLLVILAADPYPLCRYFCTVRHGYIRYIGRCIVRPADNEFRINVSFISVQTDIRICSKQNGSFFQREIRIFVIGSNFSGKSGRSILSSAEDIEFPVAGNSAAQSRCAGDIDSAAVGQRSVDCDRTVLNIEHPFVVYGIIIITHLGVADRCIAMRPVFILTGKCHAGTGQRECPQVFNRSGSQRTHIGKAHHSSF